MTHPSNRQHNPNSPRNPSSHKPNGALRHSSGLSSQAQEPARGGRVAGLTDCDECRRPSSDRQPVRRDGRIEFVCGQCRFTRANYRDEQRRRPFTNDFGYRPNDRELADYYAGRLGL